MPRFGCTRCYGNSPAEPASISKNRLGYHILKSDKPLVYGEKEQFTLQFQCSLVSKMTFKSTEIPTYSQIGCIGAGMSAVALGATLQRWYALEDIRFFERHPTNGGTWYINTYPG
jgi:hypothetical protein